LSSIGVGKGSAAGRAIDAGVDGSGECPSWVSGKGKGSRRRASGGRAGVLVSVLEKKKRVVGKKACAKEDGVLMRAV